MKKSEGFFETGCERNARCIRPVDTIVERGCEKNYSLPASVAKRDTFVIIVNMEAIMVYATGPCRCLKMKVFLRCVLVITLAD